MGDNHDDYDDDYDGDDGIGEDYVESSTTVDPGYWLLGTCLIIAVSFMCFVMPCMVYRKKWQKRRQKKHTCDDTPKVSTSMSLRAVLRMDRESKRLLQYSLPFTFSAFTEGILESCVLAIVGNHVGTKQLVAIALTDILLGLVEDFLQGPLDANTTLCAHAVGADSMFLAGQYVQLSLCFYGALQVPLFWMWYHFTDDVIMWLDWGGQEEAQYALKYIRIAIWGVVLDCVHESFSNLLEVTGHEYYTTFMGLIHQVMEVATLVLLLLCGAQLDVELVAMVGVICSGFFLVLTVGLAFGKGWLSPFVDGIFWNFAVTNVKAVKNMFRTAVPLSFGSVLGNAEWVLLTVLASYMGYAEVAAWAILGSIWSIFESTTEGIGEAAEIRVSYHLGNNHPSKAKLSAYKSLFLGVSIDSIVTLTMFLLMDRIPSWFTRDEALQQMIEECLPLIGIGNVLMTFGMLCWYMIGAQGRFKIGTWINFVASSCITLPLAVMSVHIFNFDLQGLTCSVVLGYVGVGASLAYLIFTSDWAHRARKIQRRNALEEEEGEETEVETDDEDDEFFTALQSRRSRAARGKATRNIKLLTAPPGPLHMVVDILPHRSTPVITVIDQNSPLHGMAFPGDCLISIDGVSVLSLSLERIKKMLRPVKGRKEDRHIKIMSATPFHYREEETSEVLLTGNVPDIPDFEEKEVMVAGWWEEPGENDLIFPPFSRRVG